MKTEDHKFQTIKTNNNKQNVDYLLELYVNDKWGFMGKKFIDEWKYANTINDSMINKLVDTMARVLIDELELEFDKTTHSIFFTLETILLASAPFFAMDFLIKKAHLTNQNKRKYALFSLVAVCIIIDIMLATFHIKFYKKQLNELKKQQKQQIANEKERVDSEQSQILLFLKTFLNKWPKYKKITPNELHPLFEKLVLEIDNLDHTDVLKTISEIQDQIRKNDSKYNELYKKEIASRYSKKEINPPPQPKTVFYPVFINH